MNSRERVRAAARFEGPDRPPFYHTALAGAVKRHENLIAEIYECYGSDLCQGPADALKWENISDYETGGTRVRDEWGCLWANENEGYCGVVVEHPLDDYKKLKDYVPPKVDVKAVRENTLRERADYPAKFQLGSADRFFERVHFLIGYEKTLVDLMRGEPGIREVTDMVFDYCLKMCRAYCESESDVDGIFWMDDWGTQKQLMVPPKLWRDFFKPYYKKLIDMIHEYGKLAWMHSDGNTIEILHDLIEMGLDIYNPQHTCMPADDFVSLVRGKLCIATDPDRQHVLPRGSAREVRQHLLDIFESLATRNGGIIMRAELAGDQPEENIRMIYETFEEFSGMWREKNRK